MHKQNCTKKCINLPICESHQFHMYSLIYLCNVTEANKKKPQPSQKEAFRDIVVSLEVPSTNPDILFVYLFTQDFIEQAKKNSSMLP